MSNSLFHPKSILRITILSLVLTGLYLILMPNIAGPGVIWIGGSALLAALTVSLFSMYLHRAKNLSSTKAYGVAVVSLVGLLAMMAFAVWLLVAFNMAG